MGKPVRSSLQNLSISYECALAIGNSLNLSEMLHKVIHTIVHKTNAHRGIIWVKNGEKKFQPVASSGINIEDVPAQNEIMDLRDVFNQIQKSRQFVLRNKDDKDFLQYCPVLTEKEESVLIVPVTNVAILYLVYAGREIADIPLANLLAGLSRKLSIAIEACTAHKNIIKEIQVRVEAEKELTKKTEQLISSEKELRRLYGESEQARKSLLSILEDVAQKEKALQESEEKYRTIYDSSKDAIMMLTPEEGYFSGNPAVVEIFGCKSEKEFISRTPHDLSPQYQPDGKLSSEKAEQMMAIAMEKGSHFFEWTHKRMDGKEFPATVLLTRMELQGRRVLQATIRDITERKRAKQKIKNLQQYNRLLIESNLDALVTFDHKGIIMDVNGAMIRATGRTREELTGTPFADYFTDPERAYKGAMLIFEIGEVRNYELVMKAMDGTETIVSYNASIYRDQTGKVVGAFAAANDITKRKAAEEEIKKKTEELKRFNKLAVGRELKMIKLKKEINALLGKLGEEPGYKIVGDA